MGYNTDFDGAFTVTPALKVRHRLQLAKFAEESWGRHGSSCQWVPTDDGTALQWDGNEKFYDYVEWIDRLISRFLRPWGYEVNGEVRWRGEDFDDMGTIVVTKNKVETRSR